MADANCWTLNLNGLERIKNIRVASAKAIYFFKEDIGGPRD